MKTSSQRRLISVGVTSKALPARRRSTCTSRVKLAKLGVRVRRARVLSLVRQQHDNGQFDSFVFFACPHQGKEHTRWTASVVNNKANDLDSA